MTKKGQHLHNLIKLDKTQKEVLYGALLGDGCISNSGNISSQLNYRSKSEEHVEFVMNYFKNVTSNKNQNEITFTKTFDKRTNKIYENYSFRTICNKEFKDIRNIWYPDNIKIIPTDLILTPLTCLIWYVGDGGLIQNFKKKMTQHIKLSTNGFKKEDIENILIPQLKQFDAYVSLTEKKQPVIIIPRNKIELFLNYIGDCPFNDYKHKWLVFPYKNKNIEKNGMINHKEKESEIMELYHKGLSRFEITKKLNIESSLITYYLLKHGFDVRGERSSAKDGYISNLDGKIFKVKNRTKFAKEHGLNMQCLSRLITGKLKIYKNWVISNKEAFDLQNISLNL